MTNHALQRTVLCILGLVAIVAASCGSDGGDEASSGSNDAPVQNSCPVDGCQISFVEITKAGDELEVTWQANFLPDFDRNHVHIYFDKFSAEQVSSDAESVHGVEQGQWVPTDVYPVFVTEGPVSLIGDHVTDMLCVTAADRDHAVLDTGAVDCRDISDLR